MIYAISDIHGNKAAFDAMIKKINLQDGDDLYVLGNVVDRHPDGIVLIQQIMRTPNMRLLLGNHEYMMMDALGFPYEEDGCTKDMSKRKKKSLWYQNGGRTTNKAWKALPNEEKDEIKKYLKTLPLDFELNVNGQRFKLVHATWSEIYDDFIDGDNPEFKSKSGFFRMGQGFGDVYGGLERYYYNIRSYADL